MSNWVRLWEDMPTDPKWRVISRRSGRPISEVISVFVFMMVNAANGGANATERGELSNWDDEDVGAALDMEGATVATIREAMQGKTLEGNRLTGWEKRQPKREDGSAERAKAWREQQKAEAERDKADNERSRTQPNADDRPDTDTDTEKKTNSSATASLSAKAEEFYEAFPKHVNPVEAKARFIKVAKSGVDPDNIIAAAKVYAAAHRAAGTDKQYIPAPAVWLNKGGYLNEDLPKAKGQPPPVSSSKPFVDARGTLWSPN